MSEIIQKLEKQKIQDIVVPQVRVVQHQSSVVEQHGLQSLLVDLLQDRKITSEQTKHRKFRSISDDWEVTQDSIFLEDK